MSKLVKYPNPILRKPTVLVSTELVASAEFGALVKTAEEVLAQEDHGAALAANQAGIGMRFFVSKERWPTQVGGLLHKVFVNPTWYPIGDDENQADYRAPQTTEQESCLSFPGISAPISRYDRVRFLFIDYWTKDKSRCATNSMVLEGFRARVVQHECDHLDGKLFIDYLSPKLRDKVRGEFLRRR